MNWTKDQVSRYLSKRMVLPEPPRLTGDNVKESALHVEIMSWCDVQWPRVMYIHSRMDRKTTIAVGAPDFILFLPHGKILCLEIKRKGKKRTPEQLAWALEMQRLGHTVHCIDSWAQFQQLITTL